MASRPIKMRAACAGILDVLARLLEDAAVDLEEAGLRDEAEDVRTHYAAPLSGVAAGLLSGAHADARAVVRGEVSHG